MRIEPMPQSLPEQRHVYYEKRYARLYLYGAVRWRQMREKSGCCCAHAFATCGRNTARVLQVSKQNGPTLAFTGLHSRRIRINYASNSKCDDHAALLLRGVYIPMSRRMHRFASPACWKYANVLPPPVQGRPENNYIDTYIAIERLAMANHNNH